MSVQRAKVPATFIWQGTSSLSEAYFPDFAADLLLQILSAFVRHVQEMGVSSYLRRGHQLSAQCRYTCQQHALLVKDVSSSLYRQLQTSNILQGCKDLRPAPPTGKFIGRF